MIQVQNIFQIPVYSVYINTLNLEELKKYCLNEKKKKKGRIISNRGGYQSNDINLKNKILNPLIKEIEQHSLNFARPIVNEEPQKISNMWININNYQNTNISHNHPDADISGVFYINTPKDCGNIVFKHPAFDLLSYYNSNQKVSNWTTYNSSEWELEANEGIMYLFPSWLNHYVLPNNNKDEERISMSFNTKC